MTVSGVISSTVFDVNRVIDAAYRRCKIPAQRITSEMQQIALDNLYLLFSAAPSRGMQLWAVDEQSIPLLEGVAAHPTPSGTIDVITANLRTNSYDILLARISQDVYDYTPSKSIQGRPVQYWLDRQRDAPVLMVWPMPDAASAANSTIVIRRKRHIMDVSSLTQTLDVPQRWHEAVVAELAARLAAESQGVDPGLAVSLQALAVAQWKIAGVEERDAAPMKIVPRISGYTR